MNTPTNEELLTVCEEAARTAGKHAFDNNSRRSETMKTFGHDVKLVLDRECQTIAEQTILNHFPDHAILGEEGELSKESDFEWIIDPIDGTVNFSRGLPIWCCSIAVRKGQTMLAGCVYSPTSDECFTATVGGAALLNGKPIKPAKTSKIEESIYSSGFAKEVDPNAVKLNAELTPLVCKLRILGSAALDICNVACGRADVLFEPAIYIWDMAAASLIAERAGAITTVWHMEEEHRLHCLCSTPALSDKFKQRIEKYF